MPRDSDWKEQNVKQSWMMVKRLTDIARDAAMLVMAFTIL